MSPPEIITVGTGIITLGKTASLLGNADDFFNSSKKLLISKLFTMQKYLNFLHWHMANPII